MFGLPTVGGRGRDGEGGEGREGGAGRRLELQVVVSSSGNWTLQGGNPDFLVE